MPTPCDPDFGDVVLLLNFQGVNGQTTTTDESSYARSVFQSADGVSPAALTDTYFKWPPTSLKQIDGDKYYRCAPAAETNLGSVQNWCFEFWLDIQSTPNPGWQLIVNQNFTSQFPLAVLVSLTNGVECRGSEDIGAGGGTAYLCTIPVIPPGWCHFAIVRDGDQFALYLNGVAGVMTYPLGGTGFAGDLGTLGNTGDTTLGGTHSSCNVAGIRWTVGNSRYVSNFTPPPGPFGLECSPVVPDVVGLTESDADTAIVDAGFTVGDVTTASSESVPVGLVISQDPAAGTTLSLGDPINFVLSTGSAFTLVPDLVGQTIPDAISLLLAAVLGLGIVTDQPSTAFPAGTVISQSIAAGVSVTKGTAIAVVRSTGPAVHVVPDILTLTLAAAETLVRDAGFTVGSVTVDLSPDVPLGRVARQNPIGGTVANTGSRVDIVVTALLPQFDVDRTVISQYRQSPAILAMVHNLADAIDPRTNLTNFYNFIWNVDTAKDFGLDDWGTIVGVSRLLKIPGTDPIVGFDNDDEPKDWTPMSQGRFARGDTSGTAYELPDDGYRVLILTKALANIVTTNARSMNQLLQNLFPGRGRAFVQDLGHMAMRFVFNFALTSTEYAILTQSGVLPHPAGVSYSVIVTVTGGQFFGFQNGNVLPFNRGPFNSRF